MVGLASVPYWVYFRLGKTQQIFFFSVETHVTKFDTVPKPFSLPSTLQDTTDYQFGNIEKHQSGNYEI